MEFAKVAISIESSVVLTLENQTDSNGLARISLNQKLVGLSAVLRVEADGYYVHTQNIELAQSIFPTVVLLRPNFSNLPPEFALKHLVDKRGEVVAESVSYKTEPGLDNSAGESPLQVQVEFQRSYKYLILETIISPKVSNNDVKDRIVELYKLPPVNPEGEVKTAVCPVSIVIPTGQKATVYIEWTERWAEGVINEGRGGNGSRLGSYSVFLGYEEPCSLVSQENVD